MDEIKDKIIKSVKVNTSKADAPKESKVESTKKVLTYTAKMKKKFNLNK